MEKIVNSFSLAEQAYNMLKKSIISGELAPLTELKEGKIATDLGISRTPLREAIQKLAMEELVVLKKGKPATVATFTNEESVEIMELRQLLEIPNLVKVIANCDETGITSLEDNLKQQMKAITNNDYHQFIDYDREFHLILASYNENKKVRALIHQVNTEVNRAFLILSNTLGMSAYEAYKEHVHILEVIKRKDIDAAKSAMLIHLQNVRDRFQAYYKEEDIK
ncbi:MULTISPECIES: GntR family transcriptional regulator [Sporosarcina]|uniref:GntR family transcriptional regulator n=1 Tax=Sporosarcina TaxID=1569 RepID=UPI000C169FEA|nr:MULTISPECIES: GntR family transcriptional regulator [Sporosarcina]PIC58372.1 GntR family transcriptional regulator [Sporosarcina sp. P10]PIC61463.1 GntR family transcriptional regulator [Sporosarcina sp. P12(2017)]